jgi:hypothetical protein
MMLVEKAFAKLAGGYDRLIGGTPHYALADLTGCPVSHWSLRETECDELWADGATRMWSILQEQANLDLPMCAATLEGTTGSRQAQQLESVGLVPGHAYTLLNCITIPASVACPTGARLLQLRNPWGEGREWNGDWSDNSERWMTALRRQVHATLLENDGVFYMELKDFRQHFDVISTCFVRSPRGLPWAERRVSDRWQECPTITSGATQRRTSNSHIQLQPMHQLSFEVVGDCHVWIIVYQSDAICAGGDVAMVAQGVRLARYNSSQGGVELCSHAQPEQSRQVNVSARVQAGSYVAMAYAVNVHTSQQQVGQTRDKMQFTSLCRFVD